MQRFFPHASRAAPSLLQSSASLLRLRFFSSSSHFSPSSSASNPPAASSPASSRSQYDRPCSRPPPESLPYRPVHGRRPEHTGELLKKLIDVFEASAPGTKMTANDLRTAFKRMHRMSWDSAATHLVNVAGDTIQESVRNLPRFAQRFPETFRVEVDSDGATVLSMVASTQDARAERAYANETEMIDLVLWAMTADDADATVGRDHWELERQFETTHGESFYQRMLRIDERNPAGVQRNLSLLAFAQSLPEFFIVKVTPLSTTVAFNPLAKLRPTVNKTGYAKPLDPEGAQRKTENAQKLVEAIAALFKDLPPEPEEAAAAAAETLATETAATLSTKPTQDWEERQGLLRGDVKGRAVPILPRMHPSSLVPVASASDAGGAVPAPVRPVKRLSPPLDVSAVTKLFRDRYGESFRALSERLERQNRSDGIPFDNIRQFMSGRHKAFVKEKKGDEPIRFRAVLE